MQGNLWETTTAEAFRSPSLTLDINADLVVIGGGYTGLSAALQAANCGAKVVVLEAQTVGFGGSGRNVGLVNAGLWLPPETVCKTMGKTAGERLNSVLAEAPQAVFDLIETHAIHCEAHRHGTLHYAHSPAGFRQLQDRYRQLHATGAPVTLLTAQDAKARIGSDKVFGALQDARAGTLQPLSYARGVARAAHAAGAQIYENSAALDIHHNGVWTVKTAAGKVCADRLLIATNAYHQAVPSIHVPTVTNVYFFQMATKPLADPIAQSILPQGQGCWDTGTIMTSFRKDAFNRFVIGGMGFPDAVGVHYGWARRAMERIFPQLKGVALDHAWSGKISMTADHIPKVLRIGTNGYAMFGYSGRGIGPGTVMGRAIANALLEGDETDLPLAPVNGFQERLPGLKTVFYETAARLGHLGASRY